MRGQPRKCDGSGPWAIGLPEVGGRRYRKVKWSQCLGTVGSLHQTGVGEQWEPDQRQGLSRGVDGEKV